jgi:hypothetical protein
MNNEIAQIALQSCSRGSARLILLAILLESDPSGVCTASSKRLAALAGIQRNHVSRAAKQLAAAGEVTIEHMAGPDRCNLYRLLRMHEPVCGLSQDGAEQEPAPLQPALLPPPAEDPLEAIHRLRAEAWAAFDPHGRPWHHATEAERDAFANSEYGRALHVSTEAFATQAGVSVSATGEIEQFFS